MRDKKEIRAFVRNTLKSITVDERLLRSDNIAKQLLSLDELYSARVIALFVSLPDEPDTALLLNELSNRCRVVVPRIGGDTMEFYDYCEQTLSSGSYGILEPSDGEAVAPRDIDIMIVPGVAFTIEGHRMGRGKGYYDKYMSREGFRALKIGICLAPQILEWLPCEPHDIKMDIIIQA
ncbi:MAG: 5-formyltetrahydrofolate cyclo-ligase [Bacteroidaceae bacterium]|nr:5-formyltetrahydrofolate cyclo-ligase [Bacteroidaceae bacterium]